MIQPATINLGEAIQVCDIVPAWSVQSVQGLAESDEEDIRSKECSQKVPNNTANAVLAENVKAIVNLQHVLQLRSIIAPDSTNDAKDNR